MGALRSSVLGRLEGQDAFQRLALVLQLTVVVGAGGDLRARVAEGLLDGPQVNSRLPEQRRVGVAQVVEPDRPGHGAGPQLHLAGGALPLLAVRVAPCELLGRLGPSLRRPGLASTAGVVVADHVADGAECPPEVVHQLEPGRRGVGLPVRPREDQGALRRSERILEEGAQLRYDDQPPGLVVLRDRLRPGPADGEHALLQVHVLPRESEDLAGPGACVQDDRCRPSPGRGERWRRQGCQERPHLLPAEHLVASPRNLAPLHPLDRVFGRPEPVLRVPGPLEHPEDPGPEMVEALGPELVLVFLGVEEAVEQLREGAAVRRQERERPQRGEVLLQEGAVVVVRGAAAPAALSIPPLVPDGPEEDALLLGLESLRDAVGAPLHLPSVVLGLGLGPIAGPPLLTPPARRRRVAPASHQDFVATVPAVLLPLGVGHGSPPRPVRPGVRREPSERRSTALTLRRPPPVAEGPDHLRVEDDPRPDARERGKLAVALEVADRGLAHVQEVRDVLHAPAPVVRQRWARLLPALGQMGNRDAALGREFFVHGPPP